MAERTYKFTDMQLLWLKQSLALQKASLSRLLQKERAGSEIYAMRQREITDVLTLIESL